MNRSYVYWVVQTSEAVGAVALGEAGNGAHFLDGFAKLAAGALFAVGSILDLMMQPIWSCSFLTSGPPYS